MFLSDCHIHSSFSDDAVNTMSEMAEAAYQNGISALCFTDHADDCLNANDISYVPCRFLDKAGIYEEYLKVRDEFSGKLPIRFGMEISGIEQAPETAEKIKSLYPFDFIIGSAHNIPGSNDFFYMTYESETDCHRLIDDYLDEHLKMIKTGGFDVIGHICYPMKYMANFGIRLDLTPHWDKLANVLKEAIKHGIGIEINTSGLRAKMESTIPGPLVIKLYRDLGGEIITTGSDAHCTDDAGADIIAATGILKAAGFRYVTVFENRKPQFIKI